MNNIGISLGWNCNSAIHGVEIGIRKTKLKGYLTCPFDEMVSNFDGIIKCIENDFEDFYNSKYLELINIPKELVNIIGLEHLNKDEIFIRNNKYNFLFNHESPGHANLYITQNWKEGINHYINNDYTNFKERYKNRINNFKNYLNNPNNYIIFIIHRYNTNNNNIQDLHNVLKIKYPYLKYECYFLDIHYNLDIIKNNLLLSGLYINDNEIKRLIN